MLKSNKALNYVHNFKHVCKLNSILIQN